MNSKRSLFAPCHSHHNFALCIGNSRAIKPRFKAVFTLFFTLFITGCAATPQPLAHWLTPGAQLTTLTTRTGPVQLVSWSGNLSQPLHVYIEGDGRAYLSAQRVASSPTPLAPIGLQLATADNSGAPRLYLGRPCQWVKQRCQPAAFTTQRFTEEVALDYTQLIARQAGTQPVLLVGFSGGAWLALQVAGRLPAGQVQGVITVAGNLNPTQTNAHHHAGAIPVAPMPAASWQVPQQHWFGADDPTIPPTLTQSWATLSPCAKTTTLPGLSHADARWPTRWPTLLTTPLPGCTP